MPEHDELRRVRGRVLRSLTDHPLVARCDKCSHQNVVPVAYLLETGRLDPDLRVDDLAARLRCGKCRSRHVRVIAPKSAAGEPEPFRLPGPDAWGASRITVRPQALAGGDGEVMAGLRHQLHRATDLIKAALAVTGATVVVDWDAPADHPSGAALVQIGVSIVLAPHDPRCVQAAAIVHDALAAAELMPARKIVPRYARQL